MSNQNDKKMKDLEAELTKKFQKSLEEANLKNQEGVNFFNLI